MKKRALFALFSLAATLILTITAFGASGASPAVTYADDITVDASRIITGFVDGKAYGTFEKDAAVDGRTAFKLVIDKTLSSASSYTVSLETVVRGDVMPTFEQYKYISVEYKYVTASTAARNMGIYFKNTPTIFTDSGKNITSKNALKRNTWDIAYFTIGNSVVQALTDTGKPHEIKYLHMRPLGINTTAGQLTNGDTIYLGKVTFSKECPDPAQMNFEVSFDRMYSAATGDLPAPITLKKGESFVFPECSLKLERSVFSGWITGGDDTVYQPGDTYVFHADDSIVFQAYWTDAVPDERARYFAYDGIYSRIMDGKDTAFVTRTVLDEQSVIKVVPNTASDNGYIVLDTYSAVESKKIDLDRYRYMTVLYRYETDAPSFSGRMMLNFTRGSGMFKRLFSLTNIDGTGILPGSWRVAVFRIPDLTDYYTDEYLNASHRYLRHFHLSPFGTADVKTLTENDVMYIAGVAFFEDEPDTYFQPAYLRGCGDGTFRPNAPMTRAQICAVIARLLAGGDAVPYGVSSFTDVGEDAWYARYIAYCEAQGLLSTGGAFSPDAPLSRAALSALLYRVKQRQVYGSAAGLTPLPLPPMSAAPVTRAQALVLLEEAGLFSSDADELPYDVLTRFSDLDASCWAFADVLYAAVPRYVWLDGAKKVWLGYDALGASEILPYTVDYAAGEAKVASLDESFASRVAAIRATPTSVSVTGTSYYVSSSRGSDSNDGLSPETPIASFEKLASLALEDGDGVFFRRGDTFRGVNYRTVAGVTYSAYGEGAKPEIWGSARNYADPALWEATGTPNVYRLNVPIRNDVGLVVFDGGTSWSEKRIKGRTDFTDGKLSDLDCDLCLWHDVSSPTGTSGTVYLRSDTGNPGSRFSDIELCARANIFSGASGVTIDNLSFKYTGAHAIGCGTVKNFTVTNCELGWIGGSWFRTDTLSRYGNGIEIYGGCDGYTVRNNYLYQIYDAGVTFQYSGDTGNIVMKNIDFSDNLVELTSYSFEYFNHAPVSGYRHSIENCVFTRNHLRLSGFGFGDQRPDKAAAAHIKGWDSWNESANFVMENNVFDRAKYMLVHIGANFTAWLPQLCGNTYVQYDGFSFGRFGGSAYVYNETLAPVMQTRVKDRDASVFFLEPVT